MALPYITENQLEKAISSLESDIPSVDGLLTSVKLTVTTDGEGILHLANEEGKNLSYEEVQALIEDKDKFVYAVKDESLRCYFSTTDGSSINFTNTYLTGSDVYFDCVSITTAGSVIWKEIKLN